MERTKIDVHTDGSCIGNKKGSPGGWGAILVYGSVEKVIHGRDPHTTNNRMEVTAVVEAIKQLTKPCEVIVHTDSQYAIMDRARWEKACAKKDLPNRDLWEELVEVCKRGKHHITFVKVKAHSGDPYNMRCDRIAKKQAEIAVLEVLG